MIFFWGVLAFKEDPSEDWGMGMAFCDGLLVGGEQGWAILLKELVDTTEWKAQ
jgi:hypothetical protein